MTTATQEQWDAQNKVWDKSAKASKSHDELLKDIFAAIIARIIKVRHPGDAFDHEDIFPRNSSEQLSGLDRRIHLKINPPFTLDFKVRGVNKRTGEPYYDIAVETVRNVELNLPGWAIKPTTCDYIVYVNVPLGYAYALPTAEFQRVWLKMEPIWSCAYRSFDCKENPMYLSHNQTVPTSVMNHAVRGTIICPFEKIEGFVAS